jgi:DNA-binding winged helix-turn-helix (wHTH) protein/predicted ATPase
MRNGRNITFGAFCLDLGAECLWEGARAIKLRPKAFAVLEYLVSRPSQLVTKDELLNAVWPGTFVGEAVLKVAVRQIREALDDDSGAPRFIETAHRRGYRFIGEIADDQPEPAKDQKDRKPKSVSAFPSHAPDYPEGVVGRDEALARLRNRLEGALQGQRQILFVTGEAGIGKTALVDTFLRSIAADHNIRIGHGQCLAQYGTSEAYLPVLEAIGRLARRDKEAANVLRAQAPMWLLQMPSLVSAPDSDRLSREVLGATRERMLREMGDALEALTASRPLVLVLEDLHWSDYSTLDLISYLATQRHAAQLMVIGTYRTMELIVSGHPLQAVKRELLAKKQCEEVPLECLGEGEIDRYLSVRFPENRFPAELAGLIHERTEGNPLFMINTVDYFVNEGLVDEREGRWELAVEIENLEVAVPEGIKQMIEKHLDNLGADEQRILEAASVAGAEFSTLSVAAGLDEDPAAVEEQCAELARQRQFIRDCGVEALPDGKTVSRYGFIHALYQNVLYERLPTSRRVQLHRKIGEQDEAIYGERAKEIAAELAMHFERGANPSHAVTYLQQAADNEIRRFAYPEAVGLARRGLELLSMLPDTPDRARQELSLQLTLGVPLIATAGYAAPDVGAVYLRARKLCHDLGETPEISQVLWGLWTFHTLRGELRTAREIAEEFLSLAERLPYHGLAMRGHWAMEITHLHMAEFPLVIEHFEKALLLYDPERHRDDAYLYAQNPGVAMRCFAAWALWFLGYPDQAQERMQEALTLARELSEPHGLAHALFFAAILHQLRREDGKAREYANAAIAVSGEHRLVLYQAMATITLGWTLIDGGREKEAIDLIREGLAAHRATGAEVLCPHFLGLLVSALCKAHQFEEALRVLEEALAVANRNGERCYEAELYRLKGELLLLTPAQRFVSQAATVGRASTGMQGSHVAEAEVCLKQSIEIAKKQKARSLELRAALSLARLYQSHQQAGEVRTILAPIYSAFTEGFDTPDLRETRELLEER